MNTQRKMGFTLIELLVVIAIIAILAAILFPVFAQAREKARAISCVSNQKQIGLGILQYVQDYDEYFPRANYDDSTNSGNWDVVIAPYIKNGKTNTDSSGKQYQLVGGVWACPDYPGTPIGDEYMVRNDLFQQAQNNHGDGSVGAGKDYYYPVASLAAINAPSSKWMIIEGGASDPTTAPVFHQSYWITPPWAWTNGNDQTNPATAYKDCDEAGGAGHPWEGCEYWPRYRHGGNTSNVLFCDGHVKAVHKGNTDWCRDIFIPGMISASQAPAADLSWYGAECTASHPA